MPRGRRNVPAEEPAAELEPEVAPDEVEAPPEDEQQVAPAPEDPVAPDAEPSESAENEDLVPDLGDDTEDEEDDDDEDEEVEAPTGEGDQIVYNGLKAGGRSPAYVTVIVPEDGTEPDDPEASISDGLTVTLAIGRPARVPAEAADWLVRHPVYSISRAE